jgi:Generalcontrol nonderepressible 1 (Gcn1) N-terminal
MWDKVYQKLTDVEEEAWLLRAVESTVAFFSTEVAKAEQLRFVSICWRRLRLEVVPGAYGWPCFRTQLGLAYLYLATEGHLPEFRRDVVASLGRLAALAPKTASELVRAGLIAYLARRRTSIPKNQNTSEDERPDVNKQPRFLAFLAASAAFGEGTEPALREQLLAKSVVLAHHPDICKCLTGL